MSTRLTPIPALEEVVDAKQSAVLRQVERLAVGKLCNPLAGWLHPVVKARYQNSPGARILQRAERPGQPPGGVWHRRGPARVQVLGRGAHAQLDVQNAFAAQGHRRPPGWILVAGFPDAAIHLEQLRAARTVRELTQVWTADFFLTLEQQ